MLSSCDHNRNYDPKNIEDGYVNGDWTNQVKKNLSSWNPLVVENETDIFYISKFGITKRNKKTGESTIIVADETIELMQIYGDIIFFFDKFQKHIYSVDLQGGNSKLVIDVDVINYDSLCEIFGFQVYKEILYIKNYGTSALKYNLKTQEISEFINDFNSGVFLNDKFFYTDHANKSFSIFEKDLVTNSEKLIRGDGVIKRHFEGDAWSLEWFDELVSYNGELYYTKRNPAKLYKYNESGNDELIADFSYTQERMQFLYLYAGLNEVYYAPTHQLEGNLYGYNPKTNENHLLSTINGFFASSRFAVVNNVLFYFTAEQEFKVSTIITGEENESD